MLARKVRLIEHAKSCTLAYSEVSFDAFDVLRFYVKRGDAIFQDGL